MSRSQGTLFRCSYVVTLDLNDPGLDDLRLLAEYLSDLRVGACEVIVLDQSDDSYREAHERVLRWVARYVSMPRGSDVLRAAALSAACEKVIVASPDVRYSYAELTSVCGMLERHEVVEPQEYLDPLPWWSAIDTASALVHRSLEPTTDHATTVAFRRAVVRDLIGGGRTVSRVEGTHRLGAAGAEIHTAYDLFVRRRPPQFIRWLDERVKLTGDDASLSPAFMAIVPIAFLLAMVGGTAAAVVYLGVVMGMVMLLAFHGRTGAALYFPLRACFFAPLWIVERSIRAYWVLLSRLRRAASAPQHAAVPERPREAASGE